jgi:hypothetical protein
MTIRTILKLEMTDEGAGAEYTIRADWQDADAYLVAATLRQLADVITPKPAVLVNREPL